MNAKYSSWSEKQKNKIQQHHRKNTVRKKRNNSKKIRRAINDCIDIAYTFIQINCIKCSGLHEVVFVYFFSSFVQEAPGSEFRATNAVNIAFKMVNSTGKMGEREEKKRRDTCTILMNSTFSIFKQSRKKDERSRVSASKDRRKESHTGTKLVAFMKACACKLFTRWISFFHYFLGRFFFVVRSCICVSIFILSCSCSLCSFLTLVRWCEFVWLVHAVAIFRICTFVIKWKEYEEANKERARSCTNRAPTQFQHIVSFFCFHPVLFAAQILIPIKKIGSVQMFMKTSTKDKWVLIAIR